MAIWIKWHPDQEAGYNQWMSERPQNIQDMAKKYNLRADRLYRLKGTEKRGTIVAFSDDETVIMDLFVGECMVAIPANCSRIEGIHPENLEECEWEGLVIGVEF